VVRASLLWRRGNKKKTRQLWGQEFSLVKDGLAEGQVVPFVNDLLTKYRAQLQQQERTQLSPRSLSN